MSEKEKEGAGQETVCRVLLPQADPENVAELPLFLLRPCEASLSAVTREV